MSQSQLKTEENELRYGLGVVFGRPMSRSRGEAYASIVETRLRRRLNRSIGAGKYELHFVELGKRCGGARFELAAKRDALDSIQIGDGYENLLKWFMDLGEGSQSPRWNVVSVMPEGFYRKDY